MQPDNVPQTTTAPMQLVDELISGIMELSHKEQEELLSIWKRRYKK